MIRSFLSLCLASTALASAAAVAQAAPPGYDKIDTVVVIYAENRSFDNLYGGFPGANGLANVSADQARQLDRDGTPLTELPPAWGGLTGKGVTPAVTEAQTAHLANAAFACCSCCAAVARCTVSSICSRGVPAFTRCPSCTSTRVTLPCTSG